MKKYIIQSHNLGRLANQLWQYISVYAGSLEKNIPCENIAFFEYQKYFDNLPKTRVSQIFENINKVFSFFSKKYGRYCTYILLSLYFKLSKPFHNKNYIYFSDWLFRNPQAIKKYRKEIVKSFRPKNTIWLKINAEVNELRKKYKKIIGVHIRKGDYASVNWKQLYYEDKEVVNILESYLSFSGLNNKETCFLLCSDGTIDAALFDSLSISISKGNAVEDLYKLSLTDTIIGSESTYGAFASYYGNIPHIVFQKNVDWNYYKNKRIYFENKYNSTVQYQNDGGKSVLK